MNVTKIISWNVSIVFVDFHLDFRTASETLINYEVLGLRGLWLFTPVTS